MDHEFKSGLLQGSGSAGCASKIAHSHWEQVGAKCGRGFSSSPHGPSPWRHLSRLSVLMMWWLASSTGGDPRERARWKPWYLLWPSLGRHTLSLCHVCNILLAQRLTLSNVGGDYTSMWIPRSQNHQVPPWRLATTQYSSKRNVSSIIKHVKQTPVQAVFTSWEWNVSPNIFTLITLFKNVIFGGKHWRIFMKTCIFTKGHAGLQTMDSPLESMQLKGTRNVLLT